ncbi:Smr/MutS family protein [Thalassovita mangrovi]|uniref:DNA mismatch repair protein MutS n=1 Tax=Thalassovita mangrovi TaxID=2692236 RepID=A0A6L8LGX0_9RHOB|nr:Smr/MutS family protein [Thalassovita mangrovi]MYM55347.1 DNA mismatch repair protein MutS [Thalassovita mangrovi]
MTRRRLSPEEVELWKKVADTAERLNPDRPHSELPKPKPKPKKAPSFRLPDFQVGTRAGATPPRDDLMPSISEQLGNTPVRMDQKTFGKMRRGKLVPEGRIDLHGMTLDKAHSVLNGFIMRSHAQGKRLVLVITGKGKHRDEGGPIPVRFGVLKHNVPQWLTMPPLSAVVLQVSEAHLSHGGSGAYYVYLRRNR